MTQMEQMEHKDVGTGVTDPELDEALARAIRLLISEAIESGGEPDTRVTAA
jgi:hypothetical protein